VSLIQTIGKMQNMKVKLLFSVIFVTFLGTAVKAQWSTEDSLQASFYKAKEDTAIRNRLEDLLTFYTNSPQSPEECFRQLQTLINKKDPELNYMLLLYRVVFLHTADSIIESQKYIYQFLEQCRIHRDNKQYAKTLVMLSNNERILGNYNDAFKLLFLALDVARDTLKDKEIIGGVYLSLGILYYEQNDTLKAIAFNKMALKEMTEINLINYMASVSNNLAMQYSDIRQYDSAEYYFRESIRLFELSVKGAQLRNPLINLAEVFRLTHQYDSALVYTRQAMLNSIALEDNESLGGAYWQIAKTFKDIGKSDSAGHYFQLAKESIEKYQPELTRILFYPDLAAFYTLKGDYKTAYEYLQKAIAIKDLVFNTENNKVLKEMDVKYQTSQKEKEILKQEEQIKRQRILTYSILAIAVFFLLLVFFIYRSYRQKKKSNIALEEKNIIITREKKRSDELLLNILPSEVAEELKATGATTAKDFDEVTVLFTDFKNFTVVSENLNAQELVSEINFCYSAFDDIITKHGIEKIKTIGDSYMCAGGLPVANKTNAEDTVRAALEIRDFMLNEKQKRAAEGKAFFEIRIGCNTGPVVAGIVGIKKFAYDIWGDAVNIASRMESSGGAGKVNISGSTYELVKDKFTCTHRGKIEAKNKGMIDMYFVES